VESGIGVAVVPRKAASRYLRTLAIGTVPLTDPWAQRHLRICVKSLGALPPHARWLVEYLRAAAL
jgi:DNA-binding transcriptional LysR family regulator